MYEAGQKPLLLGLKTRHDAVAPELLLWESQGPKWGQVTKLLQTFILQNIPTGHSKINTECQFFKLFWLNGTEIPAV